MSNGRTISGLSASKRAQRPKGREARKQELEARLEQRLREREPPMQPIKEQT